MKFIGILKETFCTGFLRLFSPIKIGDITLSVQASGVHDCMPRIVTDKYEYTHMEIAILKNGEFVPIHYVTDDRELICELEKHYEGTVYSCVPIELIEKIYQELKARG